MGRHSAPTEDDEEDVVAVVTEPSAGGGGRHVHPPEDVVAEPLAEQPTVRMAPVEDEPDRADTEPIAAVDAAPEPTREAAREAAPEAGTEAAPEAGTEGVPEAGSEAAPEAGTEGVPEAGSEAAPEAAQPDSEAPARKRTHSTSADLALLRKHSDLRARCIAAVVVPFLLYTAVLFAIGSMGGYLIWIWIPTVSAGVLAGAFLDNAHRRYDPPPEPPVT